ncbi:MAG TPA: peptidase U62 [Firmicutes bacterium]|jgi:predicted Zn-dependent protease|nr:peptidase U62 [Bacillota bacterium]
MLTIEQLQRILTGIPEIKIYKVIEQMTDSIELFFIKKELDMNRSKKVHYFQATIYKDFSANGNDYRGSSTIQIHPTMSKDEVRTVINQAAYAADFVKNKYYPLVERKPVRNQVPVSSFAEAPLADWIPRLTAAVFEADTLERGGINSAELFLNKINTRIINSEGVDLQKEHYRGELELITNWRESGEEVELYKDLHFATFQAGQFTQVLHEMLELSKEKALAAPTPSLNRHMILLTGEPVRDFLQYYFTQSAAQSVYEQTSTLKLNENVQGVDNDPKGDLISMKLDPFMENSTTSTPFDEDGLPVDSLDVIRQGKLLNYWGNTQYCHYLGVTPTGNIRNMVFSGGSKSIQEMKRQPFLELLAFSDFQMDPLNGNFGGEIRLGRYFDGKDTIFITGGSISGNIKEVQAELYLSQELQKENNFCGPQTIQLLNVAVSGHNG